MEGHVRTRARWEGVRFGVDEVAVAREVLGECKAHEKVGELLGGAVVESCSDYHGEVVKDVHCHGVLGAVWLAHSQHRPLVLSPDMVWITIAQGVAQHMTIHAERLRERFVTHQGRLELAVDVRDFVKGSPENDWPRAFAGWSELIRKHVGEEVHGALVCDFSTTGVVERAVSEIVLMDVFERYFHFVASAICGIPEITLEGSAADWRRVREKIEVLEKFEMGWWLEHLRPICDEFVNAVEGRVNVRHWQDICKLKEAYGGDIVNGWVGKLFPYLQEFVGGPLRQLNPIFETGEGFTLMMAPKGLNKVPFTFLAKQGGVGRIFDMEAIGGFVGVEQDRETKALRPKVGWAVREVGGLGALFHRVEREHEAHRKVAREEKEGVQEGGTDGNARMSRNAGPLADLSAFYFEFERARLFVREGEARFEIVPCEQVERVFGARTRQEEDELVRRYRCAAPEWYRFCRLEEGAYLAVDMYPNRSGPDEKWGNMVILCEKGPVEEGRPYLVVAESFEEFLRKALASGGKYWWEEEGYETYDAFACLRNRRRRPGK